MRNSKFLHGKFSMVNTIHRHIICKNFTCNEMSYFAALFQTPVVPTNAAAKSPVAVTVGFACASPRSQMQSLPTNFTAASQTSLMSMPYVTTTPHVPLTPLPCRSASPIVPVTSVSVPTPSTTFRQSPSPNTSLPYTATHSPNVLQVKITL